MADFSSASGRAPSGIPGFDLLTGGGCPRGRTTLVVGGPGCGKTIFSLQTLVEGARHHGEPGIFVAFEERAHRIQANVAPFGWNLPALQRKKVFFLDAHLPSDVISGGPFDLSGLLAGLSAKAREMKAQRIVFDGVDVLLSRLEDRAAERREVYRLYEWLTESGLTGTVTAKTEGLDPELSSHYGSLQYLADCVVSLNHRLVNGIAVRHLRVLKDRQGPTSSNEIAMLLSARGLEVGAFASDALEHPVSTEKVTSGIERLDTMLGGGYFRGTCTLVSGAPGTAKSTLSGAFAAAACARGERTLFVSFDESGGQIVRNLRSVGLRLDRYVRSGLLRMHTVRASARSSEEHLLVIRSVVTEHRARCLVVDPLSALPGAMGTAEAGPGIERLLAFCKQEGVTLIATSLLDGSDATMESSALGVSTTADTWIHLSYVIHGGERNRALTIVKSRGTGHSSQVRELILGRGGVTLSDVYSASGAVFMGTLRKEKENEQQAVRLREERESKARRRALELEIAETAARISTLKGLLDAKAAEIAELAAARSSDIETESARAGERRRLRGGGDAPERRGRRGGRG